MDPEREHELDLDVEKLESDVREMAKKISEYRQTLPDHLRNTFDSALSSHRPVLPNFDSGSNPPPSKPLSVAAEAQVPLVFGTDSEQKLIQLRESVSRNAANIPKVVKRVRECIEGIDKLDSLNENIHPAFRKRRIT